MVTVFTSVLGRTDPLRPCQRIPGVRYLVFADRPVRVEPYDCIPYDCEPHGPRLASRRLKILADHPLLADSPITLWHDAAFQLRCNPATVAETALTGSDVVAFRHPHRNHIADEAVEIARLGYMPAPVLQEQVAAYRAAGFTEHQTAITSTGFCFRRRTSAVEAWQRVWWAEVARWGWRDQMSVDYALWRTGVTVRYIPGHYRDNPHARWYFFRA
jgi:hypothetical protein